MEELDKLTPSIKGILEAKGRRRARLAQLPWPQKVKAVVQMQKMAYPIVKNRNKRACVWDIGL
jgi:hypothetical protein